MTIELDHFYVLTAPPRSWLTRIGLALLLVITSWRVAAEEIWIDVDTGLRSLAVVQGEQVLRRFESISVGRNGVTVEKIVHDRKTPLGSYRIRRINRASRFHIYFGFDYPNLAQAKLAFSNRRISYDELKAIRRAHYLKTEPPSDTPLGGLIGIHGLGDGDPGVHEDFNWTDGCIALTNEEVDELAQWARIGTRVEVH